MAICSLFRLSAVSIRWSADCSLAQALCPQTLSTNNCGSIPALWCLREAVGRNKLLGGTLRAEARNRGRFHFPGPSPRPEPLRCLIQSLQFNIPVGMELTTSSARQDTAPLSMILPDKKPATPATFVTSAPVGAMDNPALSRALSGTAPGIADEHTVGFFWKFHLICSLG